MSSSTKIDNRKKGILILGKSPTQGLEHTLSAEKLYSVIFTEKNKTFYLSLHYNNVCVMRGEGRVLDLFDVHICNEEVPFFPLYMLLFYDEDTGDTKAFHKSGWVWVLCVCFPVGFIIIIRLVHIVCFSWKKLLYKYVDLTAETYEKVYPFSGEESFRVPLCMSMTYSGGSPKFHGCRCAGREDRMFKIFLGGHKWIILFFNKYIIVFLEFLCIV